MDAIVMERSSARVKGRAPSNVGSWILAVIFVAVVLLQIELVFNRPVNWDEFFHLSEAHASYEGRLTEALQVLYARAFFWVAMLPVDSIDQIRVVRIFMFGFEMFVVAAIYGMARHFTDKLPAALAALAYVSGGYIFQHGFSYRADPMAAAFLMGSLWILLKAPLRPLQIFGAAILTALATLTTIKVVLYAPAFAGIAWLRWSEAEDRKDITLRFAAYGALAILLSLLFIGATILSLPDTGTESASNTISSSRNILFQEGWFPRWPYAVGAMKMAPLLAAFILLVPRDIFTSPLSGPRRAAVLAMMLPLASIVFYRNAFPYFYAYILPPVMIGVALSIRGLIAHVPATLVALGFLANAGLVSYFTPRQVLSTQREVISAVHDIFPEPVPYFDFPGMIVDFPKANFFMTTWGVKKYWVGDESSFSDDLKEQVVPLMILNQEPLVRNQTNPDGAWEFLKEDRKALKEGFVQHWGPIWVAGHKFDDGADNVAFPIYTPGIFTLEGASASIDGQVLQAGQTINLTRGDHTFSRLESGEATLRWGDHLQRPSKAFSGRLMFKDF